MERTKKIASRPSYKTQKLLSCFTRVLVASLFSSPVFAQSANPHAVSLYNLGLSAYKQGSPESAIIFFKRAADIDPDLADAQYNLGVLYQSERRLKEAVPRFQEVLRIKPQDQDAHFQLGLALIDLSRYAEARQHLLCIAPNSPHFAEAQKKIALADSQASGQTIAPPVTPPATQLPVTGDGTVLAPPATPPAYQAPPTTTYTPPSFQPVSPPASPPTAITPPPAPPVITPPPPVQNRQAPPVAVAPNPVPSLPNSTVRVIATGFSAPAGLAFDKQGNLYVANFLTNSIDRINADGSKTAFLSGVNLKGPIGLATDDLGNLYVANYLAGNILRISPAGISSIIATGFKKPYYLAIDRDGNLFVSQQEDNSVVRVTLPRATGAVAGAHPH